MTNKENKQSLRYGSAEHEEIAFARFTEEYGDLSQEEQNRIYLEGVQRNIERFTQLVPKPICDVAKKSVEKVIVDNSIGWSWD